MKIKCFFSKHNLGGMSANTAFDEYNYIAAVCKNCGKTIESKVKKINISLLPLKSISHYSNDELRRLYQLKITADDFLL